jgi:hypothetical protein
VRDHGLLLANAGLFAVFLAGMTLAGVDAYNGDQQAHGEPTVSLWAYVQTGDFVFQRGSSESKPLEGDAPQDADPRLADKRGTVPWPVRRGGWVLTIYEHSLSSLFFLLFLASIALHATGGARAYSAEQMAHGEPGVSVWTYVRTAQFWFESFQNWQSEFLAVAVIVGASVYLRERGSSESKPVAEPHHATGA